MRLTELLNGVCNSEEYDDDDEDDDDEDLRLAPKTGQLDLV